MSETTILGQREPIGDAAHHQTVEVTEYRIYYGDLLAEAVEHPVPRSVQLHDERAHLGGDRHSIEGVP